MRTNNPITFWWREFALLGLKARLRWWRWAAANIYPGHEDMPLILRTIWALEQRVKEAEHVHRA